MKKLLKFLIVITLILFLKIGATFTINEIIINHYNNENYDSSLIKMLYIMNFTEPYIAYYNHGNLLYKQELYKEAEEKYQIALKKSPKDSRICDIQVNLSLSKVKQIDMNNAEEALKKLKVARNVLYENHCADPNDDSGNSDSAETLEEEIKKLEKQLDGKEEEPKSDPEEEEKDKENNKDKEIEEKLKENRKEANGNRQDKLQSFESSGEIYFGKKW